MKISGIFLVGVILATTMAKAAVPLPAPITPMPFYRHDNTPQQPACNFSTLSPEAQKAISEVVEKYGTVVMYDSACRSHIFDGRYSGIIPPGATISIVPQGEK